MNRIALAAVAAVLGTVALTWLAIRELRYGTLPGPIPPGLTSACPAIASLTTSLAMTH